jgi:hypothetical protein
MSNPQNVDALTILILRYTPVPMRDNDVAALAKALSDAGVLAPSTLSDDQVRTLRAPSGLDRDPRSDAVVGAEVRAALIAIAKGIIE